MKTAFTTINRNVWLHHDEPSKNIVLTTLLTCVVLFIEAFFLNSNTDAVLTMVIVSVVFIVLALPNLTKSTTIEIDRNKREVRRTRNYIVFTRRESYPLQKFDGVKLLAKDDIVEDGYRIIRYSVVLAGGSRPLELLSVDTEREGKALLKELTDFLSASNNQTI